MNIKEKVIVDNENVFYYPFTYHLILVTKFVNNSTLPINHFIVTIRQEEEVTL